jgi:hypothetical protein
MALVIALTPSASDAMRSALSALAEVTVMTAPANALISESGPEPLSLQRVGLGLVYK